MELVSSLTIACAVVLATAAELSLEEALQPLGVIKSVIDDVVVVQADQAAPIMNDDSGEEWPLTAAHRKHLCVFVLIHLVLCLSLQSLRWKAGVC